MILEPYNITIVDLEKDDCPYVNGILRVGESGYYRLTSESYKLDKGYFVKYTRAPIPLTSILGMSYGTFVRARNMLFLEEGLANFYA